MKGNIRVGSVLDGALWERMNERLRDPVHLNERHLNVTSYRAVLFCDAGWVI